VRMAALLKDLIETSIFRLVWTRQAFSFLG
jgi:hypothetical protein